jgi:hypothetical protein
MAAGWAVAFHLYPMAEEAPERIAAVLRQLLARGQQRTASQPLHLLGNDD